MAIDIGMGKKELDGVTLEAIEELYDEKEFCVVHTKMVHALYALVANLQWIVRISKWIMALLILASLALIPLIRTLVATLTEISTATQISTSKLRLLEKTDEKTEQSVERLRQTQQEMLDKIRK